MKVVVDTNILISGLLWSGAPKKLLLLAEQGDIVFCVNAAMLTELERVLHYSKFKDTLTRIGKTSEDIINEFIEIAEVLPQTERVRVPGLADETDEKFLACALAARADVVISGDKHLLRLKRFHTIEIVSAREFLRRFRKK